MIQRHFKWLIHHKIVCLFANAIWRLSTNFILAIGANIYFVTYVAYMCMPISNTVHFFPQFISSLGFCVLFQNSVLWINKWMKSIAMWSACRERVCVGLEWMCHLIVLRIFGGNMTTEYVFHFQLIWLIYLYILFYTLKLKVNTIESARSYILGNESIRLIEFDTITVRNKERTKRIINACKLIHKH